MSQVLLGLAPCRRRALALMATTMPPDSENTVDLASMETEIYVDER